MISHTFSAKPVRTRSPLCSLDLKAITLQDPILPLSEDSASVALENPSGSHHTACGHDAETILLKTAKRQSPFATSQQTCHLLFLTAGFDLLNLQPPGALPTRKQPKFLAEGLSLCNTL